MVRSCDHLFSYFVFSARKAKIIPKVFVFCDSLEHLVWDVSFSKDTESDTSKTYSNNDSLGFTLGY